MPRGKGRRVPPAGYITATEVGKLLGRNRIYKLQSQGRLHKHTPAGYQHGYYSESEVQAILTAESAFWQAENEGPLTDEEATFAVATPSDLEALYTMAVKLFPKTATAEIRRSWMRKEPRGYYIMKTDSGRVVAYFYLLSLRPDRLTDYLHGKMPSSEITPDDLEPLRAGREVQACVIAGIGTDPDVPEEKRTHYAALLLRGVRKDLAHFGYEGIIIPRFYAFSETAEGIAMCLKVGMQQWEPPKEKRCTFVLETHTSSARILRDYKQALLQWQSSNQPEAIRTVSNAPESVKLTPAPVAPTHPPPVPRPPTRIRSGERIDPVEAHRPEGTIPLRTLAAELGISEKTLIGHLMHKPELEHIALPIPNREGQFYRYFTPEQVQHVKTWHAATSKKKKSEGEQQTLF